MHDKAKLLRKGGDGGAPLSTGVSVKRILVIKYDLYTALSVIKLIEHRRLIDTSAERLPTKHGRD